jgi:hypothetical protein
MQTMSSFYPAWSQVSVYLHPTTGQRQTGISDKHCAGCGAASEPLQHRVSDSDTRDGEPLSGELQVPE